MLDTWLTLHYVFLDTLPWKTQKQVPAKVVAQNDLTVPPFNIWGCGAQYFLIGGQRVQKKEDILIHLVSP